MAEKVVKESPNDWLVGFWLKGLWLPIHDAAGVEVLPLLAETNPVSLSAIHIRGSVAHFAVQENKSLDIDISIEQLLVVNGNDRTPAVEENLDNPEFIEAVASLDPEAAKIVNPEGDNLLQMMATHLVQPIDEKENTQLPRN
jgi:hypothetical protein